MNVERKSINPKHKGRLKNRMHDIDALKEVVEFFNGNATSLARALNVSQQTVLHWLKGETCITAERAMRIEFITSGQITRRELRPDLWLPVNEYYDKEVEQG